jgi:hypothetical protein
MGLGPLQFFELISSDFYRTLIVDFSDELMIRERFCAFVHHDYASVPYSVEHIFSLTLLWPVMVVSKSPESTSHKAIVVVRDDSALILCPMVKLSIRPDDIAD